MGLRPTQGDEKRVLFSNYCCWKRRPPLCHLDRSSEGAEWRDLRFQRTFPGNVFRPEESWAFGPPKAMKNGSCSGTTVAGSAALPFVISTGAPKERSGEICGVSDPFLGMFFDRAYPDFLLRVANDVHVCGSPQRESHADHQRHGSPQEIRGAEWRDLRFPLPKPLSTKKTCSPTITDVRSWTPPVRIFTCC